MPDNPAGRTGPGDRADSATAHPHDDLVERDEEAVSGSRAARLFDIRRIIGGLFAVYGLILTVLGLLDSTAEIDKAQGVRINLWAGLGMLVVGGLFLLWQW